MTKFNVRDDVHVTHSNREYKGVVTEIDERPFLPKYRVHIYYDQYTENSEYWFGEKALHRLSVKERLARIEEALNLLD